MSGYIKLYRGWRDTDGLIASARFSDFEAWLWLLENCAWKEISRWNAKGEEIRLLPGQIHVSIRSLSTAWGWSNKAVRTFLGRLERVQKVALSKAQSGTVLTICKWTEYQATDGQEGHSQGHSRGTVGAQSGHTQEEGKEGKEEKKLNYAFFGQTIRLTENDLARWQNRYSNISDFRAELGSLDDWLTGQDEKTRKSWFHIASGALNKKHQAARKQESVDSMDGFIC